MGFMLGSAGVVLTTISLAIFGALVLLVSVFSLGRRSGE